MLHAHPVLAIPPETRFVLESYAQRRSFGDLTDRSNREAFGRWVTDDRTMFQRLQLPADEVIAAIADAPPTIGSLSGTVFRQFAQAHGAQRWGDKRPLYVEHLPELFRLVPDAQFVHIIRDARGCTASLKELGWWGWGAVEALHKWRRSIRAGLRARSRYRADQYLEVRYEQLIADPQSVLQTVCDFLRIDFDAAMLAHSEGAALIKQPHHSRLFEPLDPRGAQRWRERLTPGELALVQDQVGPLLDRLGYPPLPDLPPVPSDLLRSYRRYAVKRELAGVRDVARERLSRLRPEPPVAARLTTAQVALAAEASGA